jgi:lysozyme
MKTSQDGINIIKKFEGFMPRPYLCPGNVLTIGYGHTGKDVVPTMYITKDKAEELLLKDLERFEECVTKIVNPEINLNQQQFDALVVLAYNIGPEALRRSTLIKVLNTGDYKKASDHFLDWKMAGGKVLAGLIQRRLAEKKLFLS